MWRSYFSSAMEQTIQSSIIVKQTSVGHILQYLLSIPSVLKFLSSPSSSDAGCQSRVVGSNHRSASIFSDVGQDNASIIPPLQNGQQSVWKSSQLLRTNVVWDNQETHDYVNWPAWQDWTIVDSGDKPNQSNVTWNVERLTISINHFL